jgi:hypothetical protein
MQANCGMSARCATEAQGCRSHNLDSGNVDMHVLVYVGMSCHSVKERGVISSCFTQEIQQRDGRDNSGCVKMKFPSDFGLIGLRDGMRDVSNVQRWGICKRESQAYKPERDDPSSTQSRPVIYLEDLSRSFCRMQLAHM